MSLAGSGNLSLAWSAKAIDISSVSIATVIAANRKSIEVSSLIGATTQYSLVGSGRTKNQSDKVADYFRGPCNGFAKLPEPDNVRCVHDDQRSGRSTKLRVEVWTSDGGGYGGASAKGFEVPIVKRIAVRNKIDLTDPAHERAWTGRLELSRSELQSISDKVGDSAAAVMKEIELQSLRSAQHRTLLQVSMLTS